MFIANFLVANPSLISNTIPLYKKDSFSNLFCYPLKNKISLK
ncbi:MAG: hypothetical protein BAJALOKI3v1_190021 [Promethearchaeota archaeon]|nr:MAG: hypothetical protein BAJALOKI3v1_190021 [Candidatus Lokiarchaeota archaeon]